MNTELDIKLTRAARAAERILTPKREALERAHALDRGFDAGEWTDTAYAEMDDELVESVLCLVCERFGIRSPWKLNQKLLEREQVDHRFEPTSSKQEH